jgi:hypothetical protein
MFSLAHTAHGTLKILLSSVMAVTSVKSALNSHESKDNKLTCSEDVMLDDFGIQSSDLQIYAGRKNFVAAHSNFFREALPTLLAKMARRSRRKMIAHKLAIVGVRGARAEQLFSNLLIQQRQHNNIVSLEVCILIIHHGHDCSLRQQNNSGKKLKHWHW